MFLGMISPANVADHRIIEFRGFGERKMLSGFVGVWMFVGQTSASPTQTRAIQAKPNQVRPTQVRPVQTGVKTEPTRNPVKTPFSPPDTKFEANQLPLPDGATPGKVIERGPKKEKRLALTIDDGPSNYTWAILDLLKKHQVHATFFFIGINTKNHYKVVQRALEEGHEVANHSWNHPLLTKLKAATQAKQVTAQQARLTEITEQTPHWFRPPYGGFNRSTLNVAKDLGCAVVMWSIDPKDWSSNSSRASILRNCLRAKAGDVVLLHEKERTLNLLGDLIEGWKKKGLNPGSMGELFTPSETPTPPVKSTLDKKDSAAGGLSPAIKPPWQKTQKLKKPLP